MAVRYKGIECGSVAEMFGLMPWEDLQNFHEEMSKDVEKYKGMRQKSVKIEGGAKCLIAVGAAIMLASPFAGGILFKGAVFSLGMTSLLSGVFTYKKSKLQRRKKSSTILGLLALQEGAQVEIRARLNGKRQHFIAENQDEKMENASLSLKEQDETLIASEEIG